VRELQAALTQRRHNIKLYPRLDTAPAADRRIIVARGNIGTGREILLAPTCSCRLPLKLSA